MCFLIGGVSFPLGVNLTLALPWPLLFESFDFRSHRYEHIVLICSSPFRSIKFYKLSLIQSIKKAGPKALKEMMTNFFTYFENTYSVGRTGAVVSVADYRPRGPWFETWPRHSLLWPLLS